MAPDRLPFDFTYLAPRSPDERAAIECRIVHPSTVEGYLRDLKGTLGRDTDHARMLMERLIGKVILRRQGRLVAEIGGNLPGLLSLESRWVDSDGAGSPSSTEFALVHRRVRVA